MRNGQFSLVWLALWALASAVAAFVQRVWFGGGSIVDAAITGAIVGGIALLISLALRSAERRGWITFWSGRSVRLEERRRALAGDRERILADALARQARTQASRRGL